MLDHSQHTDMHLELLRKARLLRGIVHLKHYTHPLKVVVSLDPRNFEGHHIESQHCLLFIRL